MDKPTQAAISADMAARGIDESLTLAILEDWNSGRYSHSKPIIPEGVPAIDGISVIALGAARKGVALEYRVNESDALARLEGHGIALPCSTVRAPGGVLVFDETALEAVGRRLLRRTAFGVLNGGSATSYADGKKNLAFGEDVAAALENDFASLSPLCRDRPKGLTPAYVNPDGSPGASFLALKMRARLVAARSQAADMRDGTDADFMPLFQMSSSGNDAELAAAYTALATDPFLAGISRISGIAAASWETGVQPMIAAFTHSGEGEPRQVFSRAYGESCRTLPLPGGHGQCFRILAPVLRRLHARGAKYASLGNVDNIGYFPDPVELALLALSGKPAAFDFSVRTPVDVKGGILVSTAGGQTIADIGPAIPFSQVQRLEDEGFTILFNCASGIFDLDWLVPRLDDLARALPVRVTDQDKDAGRYSQAEQVTWEVAGLLPGFLAFAVDKYERFIAAKLLAETLLTSGSGKGDPRIPPGLAEVSARLNEGLHGILRKKCALALNEGRWVPEESL